MLVLRKQQPGIADKCARLIAFTEEEPQIVSKTKEKKQKKEENKAKEEIKKQIVKDDEQKPATVTKEKETIRF